MVKKPSFSGPQPKQPQAPNVVARPEEPKTTMGIGAPLATSESLDAPLGPLVSVTGGKETTMNLESRLVMLEASFHITPESEVAKHTEFTRSLSDKGKFRWCLKLGTPERRRVFFGVTMSDAVTAAESELLNIGSAATSQAATLFAASSDLLTALKTILKNDDGTPYMAMICGIAKAAIAKAEPK